MSEPVIPERCKHGISGFVICPICQPEAYFSAPINKPGEPCVVVTKSRLEELRAAEDKVAEQAVLLEFESNRCIGYAQEALSLQAIVTQQAATIEQLTAKLNSPELVSFRDGVIMEASHQRERWGSAHDDGKQPSDWFWLVGYLGGKALAAHITGNLEKALHHTISTAAALANWHAAILGKTDMRPGIMEPSDAALSKQEPK